MLSVFKRQLAVPLLGKHLFISQPYLLNYLRSDAFYAFTSLKVEGNWPELVPAKTSGIVTAGALQSAIGQVVCPVLTNSARSLYES